MEESEKNQGNMRKKEQWKVDLNNIFDINVSGTGTLPL